MLITQLASGTGAFCILIGYFGLQFGWLKQQSFPYLVLNFLGGALLFYAALVTGQAGFIVLEGAWVAITLCGFYKFFKLHRVP